MRTQHLLALLLLICLPAIAPAQPKRPEVKEFQGNGPGEMTPEQVEAARRRAAGLQDVKEYGKATKIPEKPFPWMAVGMGVLALVAASPLAFKMFRSTKKDLEDVATFGRKGSIAADKEKAAPVPEEGARPSISRRPASVAAAQAQTSKPAQPPAGGETRIVDASALNPNSNSSSNAGANARDLVWDALSQAGSWVGADWIAKQAKVSANQAQTEIATLVQEGYLEQTKDKTGKVVFRIVS